MSSFSSNAILAKARSMYSHRLTEQNYEELLKRRSINDLVAYLKSETAYSDILSDIKEINIHRGQLENLLNKEIFLRLNRLMRYASKKELEFYRLGVTELEIQLILTKARLIVSDYYTGYEIEDEAGDGASALELFAQKQYDLAIVDIAMPGMNGIDLVKKIRELQYQTYVIFLTGHSDFKYAQQAIQYGVYDYILKPINEDAFIEVLNKLHVKIEKENSRAVLFDELEKKKDYMDSVLEAKIFSDYLHDASRQDLEEPIRESLREVGICNEDAYQIILLRMDLFLKEHVEPSKQAEIVQEGCRHVREDQPCLAVCDIYEDYMILVISSEDDGKAPVWNQEAEKLAHVLCKNTGGGVQCGISLLHRGTAQMGNAYAEAFSALNNAKILKVNTLSYQMVKDRKNIYYKIPNQELKDLQYHITKNNFKGCQEIIQRIFKETS